jgi:aspartate kinase
MTADPSLVPDARVIERLGFQDAAEYAFHGAEVVHAAALAPAQRAHIAVRILDVNDPEAAGTLLEAGSQMDGPVGIAAKKRVMRLDLELDAGEAHGQRLAELFQLLARHRVEPSLISSSAERASVLVVPSEGLDAVLLELGRSASVERDLALLAVIGKGRSYDADLAKAGLDLLLAAGIEVVEAYLGSRLQNQAFLVRCTDLEQAARTLHAGLLRPRSARTVPARE